MHKHQHILKAIQSELWAITPDALNQIIAIASGLGDPEALAAKLGKPLTNTREVTIRDDVAIVPIIGPIFRYSNLFTNISGATSVQTLATDLQTALDDQSIRGIILEIDSPGGQVAGISEFAAQIRAGTILKPIVAYISDIGASAAYWIASAAGEIIAADTARIGSIGVVMQAMSGDEEGTIKFISSQSPLKQADPKTDAGKQQYQKTVDALAEVFIGAVAGYRNTTREAVIANFGYGGIVIATEAIASGMADRLGSLESLIAQLADPSTAVPVSEFEWLRARSFSNSSQEGNLAMTQPLPLTREILAADHPDLYKAITEESYAAGLNAGIAQGSEAERTRIQGIEALATLGHDKLIAEFKFDGKTTASDAALKILTAEKDTRASMAAKLATETPPPVPLAPAAFNDGKGEEEKLIGQDKWEHEWKHNAELQAEFISMGAYVAYMKASEQGLVKQLGAKA
jgi:ClpP class serine protease